MKYPDLEILINAKVQKIDPVSGGDIHQAYRVISSSGNSFFMKGGNFALTKSMLEAEEKGLAILKTVNPGLIPSVLGIATFGSGYYLVMEYLEIIPWDDDRYSDLGRELALLHQSSNHPYYGLNHHNFLGNLVQDNGFETSWTTFYLEKRIQPLIQKSIDQNTLPSQYISWCEDHYTLIDQMFSDCDSCMLHGDLWSGNAANTTHGVKIYDSAVYYGCREMDMAMTLLFSGFNPSFYASYQHHFPLESGWKDRIRLCQLYPLLAHLVMFGKCYQRSVVEVLQQY